MLLLATLLIAALVPIAPAGAVTSVTSAGGVTWQIHDAAPPALDTGSIRTASQSSVQGFGSIVVRVDTTPEPRLNGEMMRGFGLEFVGEDLFETTQAVDLGGVHITRTVHVDIADDWTRFFDTFTNTTAEPVEVDVSFGGALGYGSGNNQGAVVATSSGDDVITPDDAWTVVATGSAAQRPVGVVVGSPAPFPGLTGMGNHELDPFENPLATTGHAANFYGYLNSLTIAPGETQSLARFVHLGGQGAGAGESVTDVLDELATNPDFSGLSTDAICSLANWDIDAVADVDPSDCPEQVSLEVPPPPAALAPITSSPYDVVDKTIEQLQADLEAGVTTSVEITQAYLDRITYYDTGPFGFHAYLHVAQDALEQAQAADDARAQGASGELLGIPLSIKDLFDTYDMPTTGGTRALEGWQPSTDAFQVAGLRAAGAVLIGKANMSEFARSGSYSESGWGQTWNALYPSKTAFGSSGGSAVSVAASMAAGTMGSQTGVSLYAPAVGSSLTTFRGTDGMASLHGIMPLTWAQDYGGPIARTTTDLAYLLNATTGTDPLDFLTEEADERRPDDWTDALDEDALEGKRIGFVPSSFVSSWADDGTGEAIIERFAEIEAAGGEMVEMPSPPGGGSSPPGNRGVEGWARYIELHDDFPYVDGNELQASPLVLPYNTRGLATTPRMTPEQVEAWIAYRTAFKERLGEWMDDHDVDAVVYPGFISDMYNNDSASAQGSSDRASGIPVSNAGMPTVTVPVGTNPNGYSISMQLLGRAWHDAEILGMGYALEQQAQGQQLTTHAPPLEYVDEVEPPPPPPSTVCVRHQGGATFPDSSGSGHAAFIDCLAALGIVEGFADGTYGPARDVSREQLASYVVRAIKVATGETLESGGEPFSDIGITATHGAAVYKLRNAGIVQGYEDGTFRPRQPVSRDQTARYVVNALEYVLGEQLPTSGIRFPDVTATQYENDIDKLATGAVIQGFADGTFGPRAPVTRGQMARFVANGLELLASEGAYQGP